MLKISVIVTCHGSLPYGLPCIHSIMRQTCREIEILCVVDQSTTKEAMDMLHSLSASDQRIRILNADEHPEHNGALNVGIAFAEGRYVSIINSDDHVAEAMCENLYSLTGDGQVDMVMGNFWDNHDSTGVAVKAIINGDRSYMLKTKLPFTLRENPEILAGHPSVWSAIYRSDFLREQDIHFAAVEDAPWVYYPFFVETLCHASSVIWTPEPLYYRRKIPADISPDRPIDPTIPFDRINESLDILEQNNYNDILTKRSSHAFVLEFLRSVLAQCNYEIHRNAIHEHAKKLMQRLDSEIMLFDFPLQDQEMYLSFASPLKSLATQGPKVLIYNWAPFDNPWNRGGGVTFYCRNLIAEIIKERPDVTVYFLSSGFAYSAQTTETYVRKINNIFGERCFSYEIVNSPVPAYQRNIYKNPLVALESKQLKNIFAQFIADFGPFEAIHFNNIEGLSLDVLDLKKVFPKTNFIFSLHNYISICVNGAYYQRHNHCNCNPQHTSVDCYQCTRADIGKDFAAYTYTRALYGLDKQTPVFSKKHWIKALGFQRLDEDISPGDMLMFAQTATEKINDNCDVILAVSQRTYDIAAANGFRREKMVASYIGTVVAKEQQTKRQFVPVGDGLKVVFLGNDIGFEEKGYAFLLETLQKLDKAYASQIDLVLTVKNREHAEIYSMLTHFRSVQVIQGYTHADLHWILSGCHLGIVPVLWEDNLPQIAIEMVAYGVPVLASDLGGASELCNSDLFTFKGGDSKDFLGKLTHFVDQPEDLQIYWSHHHGLVTMQAHWAELEKVYKLHPMASSMEIKATDYAYLLLEHDFLHKHLSLDEERFPPNPVFEELRQERQKNKLLQGEIARMKKDSMTGKIIFLTDEQFIDVPVGADLLKITLDKFDYSDFYAEIKFIRLENVHSSYADTLQISGTWHNDTGAYKIHLHQVKWTNNESRVNENIYFYMKENAVYFMAKHPKKYCGYAYEILTITSRSERMNYEVTVLNEGFIKENKRMPEDCFNALPQKG